METQQWITDPGLGAGPLCSAGGEGEGKNADGSDEVQAKAGEDEEKEGGMMKQDEVSREKPEANDTCDKEQNEKKDHGHSPTPAKQAEHAQASAESENKDHQPTADEGASADKLDTTTDQNKLLANISFATGRSALEVRSSTWITQSERKEHQRRLKGKTQDPNAAAVETPPELPEPSGFGKVPSLSPDEQCPPKPKGRKPKQDEESTAPTKRKRSKAAKARFCFASP